MQRHADWSSILEYEKLHEILSFVSTLDSAIRETALMQARQRHANAVDVEIGADDIGAYIENPINQLVSTLENQEKMHLLEMMYMASKFLYEYDDKIAHKIPKTTEKDPKELLQINQERVSSLFTIVNTIQQLILDNLTTNPTKQQTILDQLDKKYSYFTLHIKSVDLEDFEGLTQFDVNLNNNELFHMQHKLDSLLNSLRSESKLMRFIDGDSNGMVAIKSKQGNQQIEALYPRLQNIFTSHGTEQQKSLQFEQAVLDIYWQIRLNQGRFDSKLANALEGFLNSSNRLNLPLYGLGYRVPHDINERSQKPDLTYAFHGAFSRVIEAISAVRDIGTSDYRHKQGLEDNLRDILNNDTLNNKEKTKAMIREIIDTYFFLKLEEEPKELFLKRSTHPVNTNKLATILENFMKTEYGITKETMGKIHKEMDENLIDSPNAITLRIK